MIDSPRHGHVPGLRWLALVVVLAAACSGSGGTSAPPTGSAPASSAAGELPIDFPLGAWSVTITPEDLRAAGITEDGAINENSGTFVTTFEADGTWATLQDAEGPIRWPVFRGTFTAVGDGLMEQVTTFPPEFEGDVVRFTWRVDDGKLHLGVPEPLDPIMPVVVETHPWEPVS